MADRGDLDIRALRENILTGDPLRGDLKPGTAVGETFIDPVTGLMPRTLWEPEMLQFLEHARRSKESFAIAMIDLDGFKEFNDRNGHLEGDRLLGQFGASILEKFRKADIKGRYGGDEMIVLMAGFARDEIGLVAEEGILSESLGEKVGVGVSVGIAKWDGTELLKALIERADKRLYKNKRERKKNG